MNRLINVCTELVQINKKNLEYEERNQRIAEENLQLNKNRDEREKRQAEIAEELLAIKKYKYNVNM